MSSNPRKETKESRQHLLVLARTIEEEGIELWLKKEFKVRLKKFVPKSIKAKSLNMNFNMLSKTLPAVSKGNFNKI